MQGGYRLIQYQLTDAAAARVQRFAAFQRNAGGDIRGGQVQVHRHPVLQRLAFAGEHVQPHIDALCRAVDGFSHDPVAAAHRFNVGAGQVQRAAFTSARFSSGLAVDLDAAHAHFATCGGNHQLVTGAHGAVEHRAGDDSAAAGDAECAIDGVTQMLAAGAALAFGRGFAQQQVFQFGHAGAADGGYRQDRCLCE